MKKVLSNVVMAVVLLLSICVMSIDEINSELDRWGGKCNEYHCDVYYQADDSVFDKIEVSGCDEYSCRLIGFNSSVMVLKKYNISLIPYNGLNVHLDINGHITPDLSPYRFVKETIAYIENNESMSYRKGEEGNYFKSDKYISNRDVIKPGRYQYNDLIIYVYSKAYAEDFVTDNIQFSYSQLNNSDTTQIKCIGCELNDACFDYGSRLNKSYCSKDEIFKPQKDIKGMCRMNHECESYLCFSSRCTRRVLIPFLVALEKIKGLFK